jgi:hypothetical protein
MYISIGAALENLLTAAKYFGKRTTVAFETGSKPLSTGVTVTFSEQTVEEASGNIPNIGAVMKRSTNRNEYREKMPNDDFLLWINNLQAPATDICIVYELSTKEQLADVVVAAAVEGMRSRSFRIELSHYLVSNLSKKSIGMPGFGFGMPTFISLLVPYLLPLININKLNAKKDRLLLCVHTPAIVVISTPEDSPEYWIKAGHVYQKIALEAVRRDMQTHPMAAAIEIGDHYKNLQKIMGISKSFRPQVFFRIGYAKAETPHSPRLTAAEVTR